MSGRGIFIGYRREDSQGEAGRLDDRLRPRYGTSRVFRDVYSSPAGVPFPESLLRTVASCRVLIVLIGKRWLELLDARLDAPDDWMRMELRTALSTRGVTVIPVLVQDATMPRAGDLPADIRAISSITAHELSDSRWEYDMERLLALVDTLVPPISRPPGPSAAGARDQAGPSPAPDRWHAWPPGAGGLRTVAVVAAIVFVGGVGVGLVPGLVISRDRVPAAGGPPGDGGPPPRQDGRPPPRSDPPDGPLLIQSMVTGRCVDPGARLAATSVVQGACANSPGDGQWRLVDAGGGLWEISSDGAAGCLAVPNAPSGADAPIVDRPCGGRTFHRWRLDELGEDRWRLVLPDTGQCLDLPGGRPADDVRLAPESACITGPDEVLWRLLPPAPPPPPR